MGECLIADIDKIEADGGDRATLEKVRRVLSRYESTALYLRRHSVLADTAARLVADMLRAGLPRADIARALIDRGVATRSKAYRVIARELSMRVKRPQC